MGETLHLRSFFLEQQHFPYCFVVQGMDAYLEELSRRFARMRPRLEVIAARILGDHEEAADVVSEVYLSLARRPPRTPQALPAWLMISVRNRALNRLRTRGRNGSARGEEDRSSAADEIPEVEAIAIADLISEVIGSLSKRDAGFVTARFFEGARTEDLAAEHGTTVAQARIVLHRAVGRLRKRLVERLADLHSVPEGHRSAILAMVAKGEWTVECRCAACRRLGDELSALRKLRAAIPFGLNLGRGWLKKAAVGFGAAGLIVVGSPVARVPEVRAQPKVAVPSDPGAKRQSAILDPADAREALPIAASTATAVTGSPSIRPKPDAPTIPKTGGTNNTLSYKKPVEPPSLLAPPVDSPSLSVDQPKLADVPLPKKIRI